MTQGSCLCGAVRFILDGPAMFINHCHCTMCRKVHGAAFGSFLHADGAFFRWEAGESLVRSYASSAGNSRNFCPVCGSTVFFTMTGVPGVRVSVGNFVDPQFPAPLVECYRPMRHHWLTTPPGAESFDTFPPR